MLERLDFPEKVVEDWKNVTLYRAMGCTRCSGTGYKGRMGIYEIMPVSEAIERIVSYPSETFAG